MASREALQKLIQFGNAEQFATHAEDWSVCSSAAILNAAVEQLGKLTQPKELTYKDNAGTTVAVATPRGGCTGYLRAHGCARSS